jgi:hypothetical protein
MSRSSFLTFSRLASAFAVSSSSFARLFPTSRIQRSMRSIDLVIGFYKLTLGAPAPNVDRAINGWKPGQIWMSYSVQSGDWLRPALFAIKLFDFQIKNAPFRRIFFVIQLRSKPVDVRHFTDWFPGIESHPCSTITSRSRQGCRWQRGCWPGCDRWCARRSRWLLDGDSRHCRLAGFQVREFRV